MKLSEADWSERYPLQIIFSLTLDVPVKTNNDKNNHLILKKEDLIRMITNIGDTTITITITIIMDINNVKK